MFATRTVRLQVTLRAKTLYFYERGRYVAHNHDVGYSESTRYQAQCSIARNQPGRSSLVAG